MRDDPTKPPTLDEVADPRLRPVQLTLVEAEADLRLLIGSLNLHSGSIESRVYEATELLERLEGAGLLRGNGHHARQKLAAFAGQIANTMGHGELRTKITDEAVAQLRARWLGPKIEN